MYITRDLAPVRLLTFYNNRKLWSLFQKAWDKDGTGYKSRMYYYIEGGVIDTDNFNRFIRAIGISRSELTDIDYEGIESAWFEINLPADVTSLVELQSVLDNYEVGTEYTLNFNIGYNDGYLDPYTTGGIIDTEAALNNILANPLDNTINDNISFYDSDLLDAHILIDGSGYTKGKVTHGVLGNHKSGLILVKASVTYEKTGASIATQAVVNVLNGQESETSKAFSSSARDSYVWTFSEFDSLKKQEFVDLFRENFDTDYKEEEASWYEKVIAIIIVVVAIILAIPSGGLSLTMSLSVIGTFIGSITLYVSIATFFILKAVGMGAIGLIRIMGKVVEVLGIASAVLGVYAIIQKGFQVLATSTIVEAVKEQVIDVVVDAFQTSVFEGVKTISSYTNKILKTITQWNKYFDSDVGAEDTTKENQDMIDHTQDYIFTKSFETTEIEEHYQAMFDMDKYIHV